MEGSKLPLKDWPPLRGPCGRGMMGVPCGWCVVGGGGLEVVAIVWERGGSWLESRAAGRAGLGEAASGGSLGAGQSLIQGCGGPSHDSGNGPCWGV